MSGETTTTRGYTYDEVDGEPNDLSKLNRLGLPSVTVNDGAINTNQLADGAVTSDKLAQDVLDQINADAIIGDGSITAAKIADGAVTYVKLNQDVLDRVVRRDTVLTTVGSLLRYVDTAGTTEEIDPSAAGFVPSELLSGTDVAPTSGTSSTINVTTSKTLAAASRISGTVYFSGGPNPTFQNFCSATFNFVKINGVWNYNLIVGTGGATLTYPGGDSASSSGTNTTASGTINHGTDVSTTATATLTVTITDNNVQSNLAYNGTAYFNHSVITEVY